MIMAAPGSRSDGLTTRVLPVAIAIGIVHRGIILYKESARRCFAQTKKRDLRGEVERCNTNKMSSDSFRRSMNIPRTNAER